ncbi:DUF1302 domain-containing protein [Variovorax ureilyticus]|uniref:DUF1302 domain-containing protein n=1 Tax=Variovorax ureilyticus TaxID=1836198 RepID=A0ABU8VNF2_9BURK
MKRTHRKSAAARQVALAALATFSGVHASAFEFDTGNPDLSVRWDNTFKYSAGWRLKDQDPALLRGPNTDDGDRNFNKGLISNRLDVLTELDAVYARRYGFRYSAAGWYDSVYNHPNDNPGFAGGAFPNQISVPYNEFTGATRDIHGRKAETLDAFAFAGFDLGSTSGTVRLGQHSLVWGESLFFGGNAIAGGMNSVDVIKLTSVPNTQFKEAIRPIPQLSGQLQFTPNVSVGAYYQFKWQPNRLPAVGSYFSGIDTNPEGGERLLLAGPGSPFAANALRLPDQRADDSGQGGLQLRLRSDETDYGVYLIRFHEKTQQQVISVGLVPSAFGGVIPGPYGYRLVYPEDITALGASASRTFGDVNVAIEGSIRHNQDLASTSGAVDASFFGGPANNNSSNPAYAVGRTAHVNLNAIWTVPRTALFNEASFMGEVAWNRVLSVTKNPGAVDANSTRDAVSMRMQFEPQYRQVLSGLDLGVPMGVGYTPNGSRSRALGIAMPPDGGGDLTLGVNGTYLGVWKFTAAYTHYFGSKGTLLDANNNFSYRQYLSDRDFFALSVSRTF